MFGNAFEWREIEIIHTHMKTVFSVLDFEPVYQFLSSSSLLLFIDPYLDRINNKYYDFHLVTLTSHLLLLSFFVPLLLWMMVKRFAIHEMAKQKNIHCVYCNKRPRIYFFMIIMCIWNHTYDEGGNRNLAYWRKKNAKKIGRKSMIICITGK